MNDSCNKVLCLSGFYAITLCFSSCFRVNRNLSYSKWSLDYTTENVHFLYLRGTTMLMISLVHS